MKTDMKWNRFFKICCLLLAFSALWGGCERDYLWYDAEQKDGVRFIPLRNDTVEVREKSFGEEWLTCQEMVGMVGFARDFDRRFKVEVVDSLTTIPADRFSFEDTCYIPANETYGWLNFSYAYSEEDTLSLVFRLVENDNFRPVMASQVCFILYPYKLNSPDWWVCNKYMFWSPWTPRLNELFFQFYHAVEQTEPYIWTMFFESNLGEDFEKVEKGKHWEYVFFQGYKWKSPYENLLRKFVARPLYDHLKAHPEDGDFTSMPDPYN